MGNQNSQEGGINTGGGAVADPKLRSFLSKHKVVKESMKHPQFGNIQVYENNESMDQVMVKKIVQNTPEDHLKTKEKYTKAILNNNESLVNLMDFIQVKEQQFCSNSYVSYCIFEYSSRNLLQDFEQRDKVKSRPSKDQMIRIIKSLLNAVECVQSRKKYIHLDMKYIMVEPNSSCKLCDPDFFNLVSPYTQILTNQEYDGENLLSPTLMQNLRQKQMNPSHDDQKSQIFTVGMIVLKMGVLQDMRNLYNYQEGQINIKELKRKIKELEGEYDKRIISFVKKCLVINEELRMDLQQLNEYFNTILKMDEDEMLDSDQSIDDEDKQKQKQKQKQKSSTMNQGQNQMNNMQDNQSQGGVNQGLMSNTRQQSMSNIGNQGGSMKSSMKNSLNMSNSLGMNSQIKSPNNDDDQFDLQMQSNNQSVMGSKVGNMKRSTRDSLVFENQLKESEVSQVQQQNQNDTNVSTMTLQNKMDNISDSYIFMKNANLRQTVDKSELDFLKYNIGNTNQATILDAKEGAFFDKMDQIKTRDDKKQINIKQVEVQKEQYPFKVSRLGNIFTSDEEGLLADILNTQQTEQKNQKMGHLRNSLISRNVSTIDIQNLIQQSQYDQKLVQTLMKLQHNLDIVIRENVIPNQTNQTTHSPYRR